MNDFLLDYINSGEFSSSVVMFSGLFMLFWFMGFGITFVISIFIKIIRKGID